MRKLKNYIFKLNVSISFFPSEDENYSAAQFLKQSAN